MNCLHHGFLGRRNGGLRAGLLGALTVVCCAALPASALAASAPAIVSESVSNVTEHGATLEAQINPEGLETKYEFWVEYAVCQSGAGGGACEAIAVKSVRTGYIPAGDTDMGVSANLASLQPNYSYTYSVFATNSAGWTKGTSKEFKAVNAAGVPTEGTPVPVPENKPTPYEPKIEPWVAEAAGAAGAHQVALAVETRERTEHQHKEEQERRELQSRKEGQQAEEAKERQAKDASLRCVVPSLHGDSLVAARSALLKAHCKLGKVSRPLRYEGVLVVTGQSAGRGKKLADGTAVAVRLGSAKVKHG